MAPMKRPAAAPAAAVGGSSKRSRAAKVNPEVAAKKAVQEQCKVVAAAVLQNTVFPADVCRMLGNNVSIALSTPKEERHHFQVAVVEMVQSVLASSEQGIRQLIEAAGLQATSAEGAKAERHAAVEAATADVAAKTAAVADAKASLSESTRGTKATKLAMAGAKASAEASDRAAKVNVDKKASLESALLLCSQTDVLSAQASASVCKVCKEFGCDTTLLTSLPSALSKTVDQRGNFDKIVLAQAVEELQKNIQAVDELIAAAEPERQENAAKVAAETASFAAAEEIEASLKAAMSDAEVALKAAEDAQKAANKSLKALGPEIKQAAAELAVHKATLTELLEGALAAFEQLLALSNIPVPEPVLEPVLEPVPESVPEPVPEPAVEAPAAMDTSAA